MRRGAAVGLILGTLCSGPVLADETAAAAATTATATGTQLSIQSLARVDHAPAREISGLAYSPLHGGLLWLHNDSGDGPRLLAVDLTGQAHMPPYEAGRYTTGLAVFRSPWPGVRVLGAHNVDWEDMARDPRNGDLWVADMGNNGNARRDLALYVLPEPDPRARDRTHISRRIPVHFPDQQQFPAADWRFDVEALFLDAGIPYVLTKHRRAGEIGGWAAGTRLYRLDHPQGGALTPVAQRDDIWLATAADLSAGRRLALLTYTRLYVFPAPPEGDDWLAGEPLTLELDPGDTGVAEAVTWIDEHRVVIGSENRGLWLVNVP